MIAGVAFCPQAPVLVPEVAGDAAPELLALRVACRRAITRIASTGGRLVVLAGASVAARFEADARGSFAGWGVALELALGATQIGAGDLPPALTVAAWLLRDALGPGCGAIGYTVGPSGELPAALDGDQDVALLVMGDGSACRSLKAPGYLDGRAAAHDRAVAAALAGGDADHLAGLDGNLGAELLAAGVPAWRAAGAALTDVGWAAELLYDDAPYGVGYLVAAWTRP